MSIVVNTNLSSLMVQSNLNKAAAAQDQAMTRMSTGLKINSAADDAAGLAVSTGLTTTIRGAKVATQNAQLGASLLTTAEGTLGEIQSNLMRIRDLAEQASNGTYSTKQIAAMKTEVDQRSQEIGRLAKGAKFNGIELFNSGTGKAGADGIKLQVGTDTKAESAITLDKAIFGDATASALGMANVSTFVSGTIGAFLDSVDVAIDAVKERQASIGGFQNRLTSAVSGLNVQSTNLSAARSLIQDADIAEESSAFIQANILKQASTSLLTQANQAPSIAVNLV